MHFLQKTLKKTTFCALQNGRSYCIVGCLDFALHRIIPLAARARRVFQRQPGRLRLNSHLRCSAAAAGAMERPHSDQPAPPSLHHRIHPGNIKSIAASQSSPVTWRRRPGEHPRPRTTRQGDGYSACGSGACRELFSKRAEKLY